MSTLAQRIARSLTAELALELLMRGRKPGRGPAFAQPRPAGVQ